MNEWMILLIDQFARELGKTGNIETKNNAK